MRRAIDREHHRIGFFRQGFGGEHHPGIFLRACVRPSRTRGLNDIRGIVDRGFGRTVRHGERQKSGTIAQARAIIFARIDDVTRGGQALIRLGEDRSARPRSPKSAKAAASCARARGLSNSSSCVSVR